MAASEDILVFGAHRSSHWQGVAVMVNRHWEPASGESMFGTMARSGCLQDAVNGVPIVVRAGTHAMPSGARLFADVCTIQAHPVRSRRSLSLRPLSVTF